MPGLGTGDLLWPGRRYHVLGVVQDRRSGERRTHLAAFNPASREARVRVEVIDQASGLGEGFKEYLVRSEELIHVNEIVADIVPEHDEAPKRLEITVDGPVHLLAFGVNATGDPVTLAPLEARWE